VDDARRALVAPVDLDAVVESGLLSPRERRAWAVSPASLRARAARLRGLAVATDRIEAFVLYEPVADDDDRTVVAFGAVDAAAGPALLGVLLACAQPATGSLRIAAVDERHAALLEPLGLRRDGESVGYVAAR
jgi:hypothetical protein